MLTITIFLLPQEKKEKKSRKEKTIKWKWNEGCKYKSSHVIYFSKHISPTTNYILYCYCHCFVLYVWKWWNKSTSNKIRRSMFTSKNVLFDFKFVFFDKYLHNKLAKDRYFSFRLVVSSLERGRILNSGLKAWKIFGKYLYRPFRRPNEKT